MPSRRAQTNAHDNSAASLSNVTSRVIALSATFWKMSSAA
jgi:hypothetical protein